MTGSSRTEICSRCFCFFTRVPLILTNNESFIFVGCKTKLKGLFRDLKDTNKCLILCTKITGAWPIVCSTTFSGTVLADIWFRDFLCARYNVSPLNLQIHCDGCGTAFGVADTLSCITSGLVISCHNKIRDKLLYLSRRVFTSAYLRVKPLSHQGCTRSEKEICQGSYKDKEIWGSVMVQGL